MKAIGLVIVLSLLMGCSRVKTDNTDFKQELENIIIKELIQNGIKKNTPILFVAEGMCSECINREFINLKNDSSLFKSVVIVGLFSKKRYFTSSIGNLTGVNNIYINKNHIDSGAVKDSFLFYSIFDVESSKLTNIFYPDPCDVSSTLKYYRVLKEKSIE
jgi:hypothetical protein